MTYALKLQASTSLKSNPYSNDYALRRRYDLRLPVHRFASFTVRSEYDSATSSCSSSFSSAPLPSSTSSEPSISSQWTSSVGSSSLQLSQWNLTQRHILLLNVIACAAAVAATWLFFSVIPTLLAFKRAAESLEKLMDVTREELPDTMAAVRLSGMEISDLTMELSDLGQDITQGVRSSTRAVRMAEERLRQLTKIAPQGPASMQLVPTQKKTEETGPALARTARSLKEGIVKGRSLIQMFFTFTRFSRMSLNYLARRAKQ